MDIRGERMLQLYAGRVSCVASVTVGSFARVSSDVGGTFVFLRVFGDRHNGIAIGVDSSPEGCYWCVVRVSNFLCADGRVYVRWELSETMCYCGFDGGGERWNV